MKKIALIFICLFFICGCMNENKQDEVVDEIKDEEVKLNIPDSYNDNGIFIDYYEDAYEKMKSMTMEEKVGQMIFARMPQSGELEAIEKYNIGGFILFGIDFENKTKEEIIDSINLYQESSVIPLLMGVDEEGGSVVRISSNSNLYPNHFQSLRYIYNQSGISGINLDTSNKSILLKELGLNVNLAPVADYSNNPNDFIYDRTVGNNIDETSECIKNIVRIYNENNIGCTLKHFPGYGNNVDTHTGIAIDNRDYNSFLESDFKPFIAGIEEGAPSILVSHNIVTSMDEDNPASLSKKVHDILRDDLDFTGVIMTDDLAMNAITLYTDNPYVSAVLAGNDLLITSDYKKTYDDIIKATLDGVIDEEVINKACFRVLAWKYKLGLLKRGE